MKREALVRQEKELMVHYTCAHEKGDERRKAEVMRELERNIEQRKFARKTG